MSRVVDWRVAMATGVLGAIVALWAALGMPWWSSGGEDLIGLRLHLLRFDACFMGMCEGAAYGELPADAFSKDPTSFVLLGRIALGAAVLASVAYAAACALRLSGKDAPERVSPERLAILFAAVALVAAVLFVALRPDVAMSGAPENEGFEAMLTPELGLSAGFPTFAMGCVLIALGAWLLRGSFHSAS